jgi:hypothetical protein
VLLVTLLIISEIWVQLTLVIVILDIIKIMYKFVVHVQTFVKLVLQYPLIALPVIQSISEIWVETIAYAI